jgi:putative copper resistance protein D
MDDALILVRAIHLASCALVSGGIIFVHVIAGPVFDRIEPPTLRAPFRLLLAGALAVSVVSGLWWFLLVDAQISGRARLFETFSDDTLWIVLEQTQFGLIFQLRGVSAALLIWIVLSRRNAHATRRPVLSILSVSVAVFYIGTIAWMGHAGASPGRLGYFHLTSDFLHLVTAGAWLGGLAPLAITLYRLRQSPERVVAIYGLVQRFSDFGVAVVAILLASGVVNAWFLLGSVHALIGTEYGRLLMVKIALFVAMVSLAALNRLIFVPRLSPILQNEGQSNSDAKRLQRSIGAELCLGMAIIFVVGILGIMAPAAHLPSHIH